MRFVYVFLSLTGIIAGTILVISVFHPAPYSDPGLAMLGILLIAGGLTSLWKLSGFRGLTSK
jgi:hypothetical protein